jgi:dihydropyrimidinase
MDLDLIIKNATIVSLSARQQLLACGNLTHGK